MERIFDNIGRNSVCDSEIIQDIERIPGFDINLGYGEIDWSSLMWAVGLDRKELVRYLLSDSSINVNHRSNQGNTALYFCDQVSILKLLLDRRDLNVNIQNNDGETGLHRECYQGRKSYVKEYLLDARVDTSFRDNKEKTAQDYALERGYSGIAKIITNSLYTTLLRTPNNLLLYDIVRMIIEKYA